MDIPEFLPLPNLDHTDAEFSQRAQGAVIGSAVGDALGAPFEFQDPNLYAERFPEPVLGGIGEMRGGGLWDPAEFTDDTQMAVVQANSLLNCRGLDESDLFERFRAWGHEAKDVGIQTSAVLSSNLIGSAAAAEYFRDNPRSAGNGTIMRAAPSAVLLARATEAESVEWAKRLSAVTHGDPATGWGQAIVHVFIRSAVRGDDPWHALRRFLKELPESQELYGRILAEDWTPDVGVITAGGERIDNNGTVWTCLAQAMWAVRSTDSFADAVVRAINLGGDTDTVAAVAGALAGAIHGIAGIPSRWTTYLNGTIDTPKGKDHLRLDDLRRLTQRLLGSNGPARQSDLYPGFGPTEIAPGVHAADLAGASLAPKDWGIVSLCLVDDRFVDHPHRREIYLVDQEPSDGVNPNLGLAGSVRAAVDAVRAFRAEGLEVVVHCYGGASRTGLVLRAYLMSTEGMTDLQAIDHIEQRWPYLGLWSESFTDHLASDWERDTTG